MAAKRAVAKNDPPKGRELSAVRERMDNVRGLLDRYKEQMSIALPKHLSPDRMLRLTMTTIANEPKLLECTQSSLVGSVMQLAQLGLEPGVLGHAYLLPYWNGKKQATEAQIIVGYKGLLKLARNSGQISTVMANVVYEPESSGVSGSFEYSYGLVDKLHHVPTDEPVTPDDLTHAYSIVKLKDGGVQWEVMNRREVLEVKSGSRAGNSGPWKTHEPEMWKKTVLRRICKLLPSSIELQTAIALDENADAGIPQTFDVIDVGALAEQENVERSDQSQGDGGEAPGAEEQGAAE
ncbi:MAG: recombinase RecT [Polyangiales bacterium]